MIRYINRVEPGYDRRQVIGMASVDVLYAKSRDGYEAALRATLEGEPQEIEAEVLSPDGLRLWYRSRMRPYRDGDGIVGAVIMAMNITELKAAQHTAAKLRQLLPLCSWCERIRAEDGSWDSIERYIEKRMKTRVTHGLWPDCFERQIRELGGTGATGDHVA